MSIWRHFPDGLEGGMSEEGEEVKMNEKKEEKTGPRSGLRLRYFPAQVYGKHFKHLLQMHLKVHILVHTSASLLVHTIQCSSPVTRPNFIYFFHFLMTFRFIYVYENPAQVE